jgi:hypothetical protein
MNKEINHYEKVGYSASVVGIGGSILAAFLAEYDHVVGAGTFLLSTISFVYGATQINIYNKITAQMAEKLAEPSQSLGEISLRANDLQNPSDIAG